ncbi:TPA: hypothetical protein ACX6QD_000868 [Photobacterium damselae]
MNRYYQQGMSTLLITSMLLVVALIFSLASYKNLFYQIKRTQNEVLARQAHWAAEGGLECGFAEISNKSDVNTSLDKCKTVIDGQPLTLSISTNDGRSLLTSETNNKYKKITKTIVSGGARSSGVIKSTADLYFKGEHVYYADPNAKLADNTWACLILRYKNNFYINDDSTSFFINKGIKPNTNICSATYITDTKETPDIYNKDIQYDNKIDVFKETFNKERVDWEEVRDSDIFVNFTISDPNKCAEEITDHITNEKRYIWATGNCFLEQVGLNKLSDKSQDGKGIFLLIENGLLSVNGTSSNFKGIIYHFINDYTPVTLSGNEWSISTSGMWTYVSNLTMYKPEGYTLNVREQEEMRDRLVFFMNGSFVPSGGYIFDTPEKLTYFNMASELSYDGTLINDLLSEFGKPRWQQGSWHDF